LLANQPSDCFVQTRSSADSSDSSVHPEGPTEHRDGILPVVTLALEQNLNIPSQSPGRPPSGEASLSGEEAIQVQAGSVTEPKSRPRVEVPRSADVHLTFVTGQGGYEPRR
jgi:hypothetical protein